MPKQRLCAQVLCCDWCKYNDCLLATAGVDKALKVWDVRKPHQEVAVLLGHTCALLLPPMTASCVLQRLYLAPLSACMSSLQSPLCTMRTCSKAAAEGGGACLAKPARSTCMMMRKQSPFVAMRCGGCFNAWVRP